MTVTFKQIDLFTQLNINQVANQGKVSGGQNIESYQSIQQLMSSINDEFDSEVKQLQDMYEQMRKSIVPLNVV